MNDSALLYEYCVVRYVPRVEREEFINVGLMMMCKRQRWLRCAISLDTERIKAFDPGVDFSLLQQQLGMFEAPAATLPGDSVEERFRWLSAVKSSCIQTSRPHPGLADVPEDCDQLSTLNNTFETLLQLLV